MSTHKGRRIEVATDDLSAVTCIDKIPYTRGLDDNHVDELIKSFCRTGTINREIWFVFWGCTYASQPLDQRWDHSLEDLAKNSIGVGPMTGQHSVTAIFRCRRRFPNNPHWAKVSLIPVMCDDSKESRAMIECWGLRSNYVAGTFLSPQFKDTALAMRRSYEDTLRRTNTTSLTTEAATALCVQFATHGGITLEYCRQIWALVRRGAEAWSRIAAVMQGVVQKSANKTKFKEIKSPALFQPMVVLDDKTVCHLLDHVIAGKWDKKIFISQCKFYKCQLELKRQIMEWMVMFGHIDAKASWESLLLKFPQGDLVALVDTWSNSLKDCKMSERRTLPMNIAEALTEMVSLQQRVTLLNLYVASQTHLHLHVWLHTLLRCQARGDGKSHKWTFGSVTFTLYNSDMFGMASVVPRGKHGTCLRESLGTFKYLKVPR